MKKTEELLPKGAEAALKQARAKVMDIQKLLTAINRGEWVGPLMDFIEDDLVELTQCIRDIAPEETLLPCPFCGGLAQLVEDDSEGLWVDCKGSDCSCKAGEFTSKKAAVKFWNSRKDDL